VPRPPPSFLAAPTAMHTRAAAAAAAASPAAITAADSSLPRHVVRLSGVLASLLGRAEGGELSEDELLDGLRAITLALSTEQGGVAAAAASVLTALLRPGGRGRVYEDAMLGRLREAGLITYPSPLFRGLLEELPEVFAAEVLPKLDPADLAFVAQVDSGCRAAVVASGLPCAGTRVGMRELTPEESAGLAWAVRAAPPGDNFPGDQLEALGYVDAEDLPRTDGVVRLELEEFCTSAGRLAWAKASGCRWDEWTSAFCARAIGVGSLGALKWARDQGCPWDEWTCADSAWNGRLDLLQWAREHHCPWHEKTCEFAAAGGHLEVLQWARQHDCPWDTKTCEMAAEYGHLEVLQWARQHDCPWDTDTCSGAALGGQLEVLRWLRDHDCPWDEHT